MSSETFAHRIRKLRKAKKWTQKDLARASGVSRRTICRYEWNGVKPRTKNLRKLAAALECTVDQLMGRESLFLDYSPRVVRLARRFLESLAR